MKMTRDARLLLRAGLAVFAGLAVTALSGCLDSQRDRDICTIAALALWVWGFAPALGQLFK